VVVGQQFVLDLRVNSGLYFQLDAQQAYLSFPYQLLQNVNANQSGCVLTSTVTIDTRYFDTPLQNEVCNGPNPCSFSHDPNTSPGYLAFASGVLGSEYADGDFRVAQIAFCGIAAGQAVLHWQFSPPDPPNRNTAVHDAGYNYPVNEPSCYVDYVINILPIPTQTPARVLDGHVTWQGPPSQPSDRQSLPVKVVLQSGASSFNYPGQMTDANGSFSIDVTGLASGTYSWWAKGPRYLAKSGVVTLSGGPVTNVEMGLMQAGDANNDNRAGALDFTILRNGFGGSGDLRADFDNDGVIDLNDFVLLKANFGAGGAPPP
jgi:hypothetical protein